MSQEIIAILEQIEREKGIKKELLIEAVEIALLTAVRKVIDVKPEEVLKVELDRATGKIRVFKDKEEVVSDFGRIAASTARQVIIQKIREAEKEVVFHEFKTKIGELVSGIVYRFDRGNIIVDLLGKAEGYISKQEQSPSEEFKQGQRIRAYVVDVRKDNKGLQIVLSRTHPNLVKKLFELEVPEIYEGIVEIKAIARQPGERTKIAVWSKNEKVDSVGACVGMRGNRVRNIVNELFGEKIDIIRYNEDIKEYVKSALSPAKINEIKLEKNNLKADIIVDDDQLSLCIGKHGQNVRLASRLIGWELNIHTKSSQPEEEAKQKVPVMQEEKKTKGDAGLISLEELSGVGEKTVVKLKESGFNTIEDIVNADVEDLLKVKGIARKKAEKLIEEAKKLIKE